MFRVARPVLRLTENALSKEKVRQNFMRCSTLQSTQFHVDLTGVREQTL
jgi:hypothetical protein